jgi:hypothetical protein
VFTAEWAAEAVARLSDRGHAFGPGLTDAEIARVSEACGVLIPPELAMFLQAGRPLHTPWDAWGDKPEVHAAEGRAWVERAFRFDIGHNGYWHPRLGDRPDDPDAAVAQALEVVRAAPPPIPIYGHRFLTTAPAEGPGPVLSVYQAVDSIIYGNDLADYFTREFGIERPPWAAREAPTSVPVWDDLFDLYS